MTTSTQAALLRRIVRVWLVLMTFATWLSTAGVTLAESNAERAVLARNVLRDYCYRCHNGNSEGGEYDFLKVTDLTGKIGNGPLVVPGKPKESLLLQKLSKNEMPPKSIPERPDFAEGEKIREWIEAGAPMFPEEKGRAFVTTKDVLNAIHEHLQTSPEESRKHQRYFTLHHLYNLARVTDEDLRLYRAALSKALNSLSWKPRIVVPKIIDKAQTVMVIDVRDLDWDRNDLWRAVMKEYPYGLQYDGHPDDGLRELDQKVRQLTGNCDLPHIRADWFVAEAARPPLYYTLLQIPKDAAALERRLNVNVAGSFQNDKLIRAGFTKSGVSGQNRLVERHDADYGAYWKSYDFKEKSPRNDLKKFPLGPVNLFAENRHPYSDEAFIHDGGEIIFHLPNHLQGYMLIGPNDNRIDAGPEEVVNDPLKTSGTNAIVNGLSCMACHKHGTITFKDDIRIAHATKGQAALKVKRLYPEQEKLDEILKEDKQRFMAALEKAIGPFLREVADKERKIETFPEPVQAIALFYRARELDAKQVACELGLESFEQLEKELGKKRLQELGLGKLSDGGVLKRFEWSNADPMSLMQRVARDLKATPIKH